MAKSLGDKSAHTSTKVYQSTVKHTAGAARPSISPVQRQDYGGISASISPRSQLIWPSELEVSGYGPISYSASWAGIGAAHIASGILVGTYGISCTVLARAPPGVGSTPPACIRTAKCMSPYGLNDPKFHLCPAISNPSHKSSIQQRGR